MGSVSAPSRAMLMTGRYGQRFGFECNLDDPDAGVPNEEETLGDIFRENGYATAALGKWHLGFKPDMHPNEQALNIFMVFWQEAVPIIIGPIQMIKMEVCIKCN